MTNLFRIFNMLNYEASSEPNCQTDRHIPQSNHIDLTDHRGQPSDIQDSCENLNTDITNQYTINNTNAFDNIDSFNDNQQLPFMYIDMYSLQTIGTAQPDL